MTTRNKNMRMNGIGLLAYAFLLCLPGIAVAKSTQQAGASYEIRAHVPVACWVKPSQPLIAASGQGGEVTEACNSPGGFTVFANYRPLKASEKASMVYGANALELSKSGHQALRRANMAQIRTISYRFAEVSLEEPLVLSLTIRPI